jgi:hypothetical protein
MKRLFLVLAISTLFASNSFADDIRVSVPVLQSFNQSFKNATEISWSSAANYFKVHFKLNEEYASAFYDQDGKLIALIRNISSHQLPLSLQLAVKRDYEQFWITDLLEITNEQGTSYFLTVENANNKIVLRSTTESEWMVFKKTNK